jgi:hypothetical protein
MQYLVVRRDSRGVLRMGCVAGPEAAERFLQPAPPDPAAPVEE